MKNLRICHLFQLITQNQYSRHPTHSPWSCHILPFVQPCYFGNPCRHLRFPFLTSLQAQWINKSGWQSALYLEFHILLDILDEVLGSSDILAGRKHCNTLKIRSCKHQRSNIVVNCKSLGFWCRWVLHETKTDNNLPPKHKHVGIPPPTHPPIVLSRDL